MNSPFKVRPCKIHPAKKLQVLEAGRLLPEKIFSRKKPGKGVNTMMLVPKYVAEKLPSLYSAENDKDPMVICKFFLPMTKWYWYAIEFDGKDRFFGYVVGEYNELGYFTLSELDWIEGLYGIGVERDMFFEPQPLSVIKKLHEPQY